MVEHDTNDSEAERDIADRYRHVEYEEAGCSVSIIQDTENEQAWIQSTYTVPVEP